MSESKDNTNKTSRICKNFPNKVLFAIIKSLERHTHKEAVKIVVDMFPKYADKITPKYTAVLKTRYQERVMRDHAKEYEKLELPEMRLVERRVKKGSIIDRAKNQVVESQQIGIVALMGERLLDLFELLEQEIVIGRKLLKKNEIDKRRSSVASTCSLVDTILKVCKEFKQEGMFTQAEIIAHNQVLDLLNDFIEEVAKNKKLASRKDELRKIINDIGKKRNAKQKQK